MMSRSLFVVCSLLLTMCLRSRLCADAFHPTSRTSITRKSSTTRSIMEPASPDMMRLSSRSRRSLVPLQAGFLQGLFGRTETGPKVVIDLPATDVKIGALRFLLQIYLVGEQNKPTPNSWLSRQGDGGDLQVYYQDGTGMFAIELQEYSIKIRRYGERPSLQYMLQESVLLHGVLDELNTVAFGVEDIATEKRLLRLTDDDAISKARETLPARKQ